MASVIAVGALIGVDAFGARVGAWQAELLIIVVVALLAGASGAVEGSEG